MNQLSLNTPERLAYSIKEAFLASSLGTPTLYNHIAAGRLAVRKVGGRTIIPAEALRAFVLGEA